MEGTVCLGEGKEGGFGEVRDDLSRDFGRETVEFEFEGGLRDHGDGKDDLDVLDARIVVVCWRYCGELCYNGRCLGLPRADLTCLLSFPRTKLAILGNSFVLITSN